MCESGINVLILDEGVFVDGLDDVFEKDFGGEGVAVVHDGLTVLTVPTVHCGQERRNNDVLNNYLKTNPTGCTVVQKRLKHIGEPHCCTG